MSTHTREALDAVGGAPFVQKIIDPMLLEYQRRYSPLVAAIPSKKHTSDVYYFNRRDRVPAGGNVRDGGARPLSQSVYDQKLWRMKHFQTVGDVTGYAEEVTAQQVGSLRGLEIEGGIQGLYWDMETQVCWGNAEATEFGPYPQFSGFDTLLSTYNGTEQNAIDRAGATLSTGALDMLIDMVETNAAETISNSQWMFTLSPTALSRIAQLLQNQQRFVGQVEIAAGLNVMTYRDVPLMKSSFLSTRSATMGTVVATPSTTGGTLPAGALYYRVSAIIARSGETVASSEATATTTGATGSIALTFAAPSGLDGLGPILYKVYRGTATGVHSLVGVVDAVVALAADGVTPIPTVRITDTGTSLVPSNASVVPLVTPTSYYGTNLGKKPVGAGHETLHLVSRDERNLVRPYVRELAPLELSATVLSPDSQPYAVMSDTVLALRAPKFLGSMTGNTVSLVA